MAVTVCTAGENENPINSTCRGKTLPKTLSYLSCLRLWLNSTFHLKPLGSYIPPSDEREENIRPRCNHSIGVIFYLASEVDDTSAETFSFTVESTSRKAIAVEDNLGRETTP